MDLSRPNLRPGKIGVITHGSLSKGVEMKLDATESIEDIIAGAFVVVQGEKYDFFSLITDVTIAATNENILLYPPTAQDELLLRVMDGMGAYAKVEVKPMLMMGNAHLLELSTQEPRAVKTVPTHFSQVTRASRDDVVRIFGDETHGDGRTYLEIGEPLGMDGIPLCLHLPRFVERSNAVFGKTGTGKTFLTRILLCGAIKTGAAVNLIFDMHSEYGDAVYQEDGKPFVKGLKDLFPQRVSIFSLDRNRSGGRPDHEVYLYADQIKPGDILPLRDTLNLNPTAPETCESLQKAFGEQWLSMLLDAEDLKELSERIGAHEQAVRALQRKLKRIARHDFFSTAPSKGKIDVLNLLLETIGRGRSVVFEFGRYTDLHVYLLVANVITRRIRDAYETMANEYRRTRKPQDKPRQLMITIEEAHKFLAPGIARETPFGKIAREMRKYFVSLLVVDQRPSAIDEEVLSQIGTKLICQLSDEKDIGASLVGESGASGLRNVLAAMDAKQQALLLGHAVPMPMVLRTRMYDESFFDAVRDRSEIQDADMDLVQG